jgi:D-lactate dehydrogenase (cytochrome)
MMAAINKSGTMSTKYPAVDTLFFKIQGSPNAIKETANDIRTITKSHGSKRFEFAASDEEATHLWQNRKDALFATLASHPGNRCWTTDVW